MIYLTGSKLKPDFFSIREENWVWYIFPWNRTEDLRNLSMKLFEDEKSRVLSLKDIRSGLKRYFGLKVQTEELRQVLEIAKRLGKLSLSTRDHWRL
jgi:hypoxanthine phosphoribosyltransferase